MVSVDSEFGAAYRRVLADEMRGRYDEVLDGDGAVRPHWTSLVSVLDEVGSDGVHAMESRVRRLVDDHGITYNPVPVDATVPSTPPVRWGLDDIPLIVSSQDWEELEAGLQQRSRLLDAVLNDFYGPLETVRRGLVPPQLVFGDGGYLRAAHGITIPGPHQLFLHAADVARAPDGTFEVVADRTQAPSGIGYALADRRVLSRATPELFQGTDPRPLSTFARALGNALIDIAPAAAEDPVVVVLSPGSQSETAFDQAYLATVLGFPLVENADLVVRDGFLWMRTSGTLRRVDVVLRRVDAEYTDPLDLRAGTKLGIVGLVEVLRRGAVSVVNTLGSGVLESPALPTLLPALSRALLGEDLLLPSTAALWGGSRHGVSRLTEVVRSTVFRSVTDRETVLGPDLDDAHVETFTRRLAAEPWKWVGQRIPTFSTAPSRSSAAADGFGVAEVGLRLFSVAQRGGYTSMTGGLGELIAPASERIVSKDVWVRSGPRVTPAESAPHENSDRTEQRPQYAVRHEVDVASSPRVLGDLFWFGRYSERAENMTRLLIAARERHQDYRSMPWLEGSESLPVLLRAVTRVSATGPGFFDEGTRADAVAEFRSLTLSVRRTGSVAQSVDRVQQAARAVRDQLSTDTWAVLGRIESGLVDLANAEPRDVAALAAAQAEVLRGLSSLSGLASESMVRDTGWYSLDIGKRIERGLAVTALLSATLGHPLTLPAEQAVIDSVLAASESSVIYRRRNHGPAKPASLAQLLLFDPANPRSLAYQLGRLREDLGALPDASSTSPEEQLVELIAVRLRRVDPTDLDTVDASGQRLELVDLVDTIHARLLELSRLVLAKHMVLPGGTQPLWGTVGDTRAYPGPSRAGAV